MATFDLGTTPSLMAQMAAAQQIEAQQQNALANQVAMAVQQEKLRQLQDPQAQALERLQAQLGTQIQQSTLNKNLRDLDPAYQQKLFDQEIRKAATLYGLRPQYGNIVKDELTGEYSVINKQLPSGLAPGQAAPITQAGGPAFSTGVKPTFTDLVDETTGVKRRFALNPDGSLGAPIGVAGLPQGTIVKDEVTGTVSVVNPQLPTGTAPGQAATVTKFTPPTAPSTAQPTAESGGPQPFKVTPKPKDTLPEIRYIRDVYDDSKVKISYFGKGELPGSDELKERLDTLLANVGGDYTKLNPQAKQTFVFAMNNFRDPRSATLLSEAESITGRVGLADRFKTYLNNLKTGDNVSPEVAKDIYTVISQGHASQEDRLINDLMERKVQLNRIGSNLSDIGVPKDLADKVDARIALQSQATGTAPVSNQNQQAIDWLKANPNHRRAPEMRKKLQSLGL